ncbi:DinB family protein [Propionibacteriaceae bacterium Y1685]|uniref:DinB family protein n=1 Tax=Microlunatus sp. Y1700 TaxID=3418487 RepID=UPI003B820DC2
MPYATPMDATFFETPLREQFDTFIDQHRTIMAEILDDLTEEEARRSLVPSRTTLLGLVKHVTFVEKVWFNEAITGRSREDLGLPSAAEDSFLLEDSDTIDSVRQAYVDACTESRERSAALDLDDALPGNRRGPLPLRWVLLHVLREVAQHCGHAEILREQILASRTDA